MRGAGCGVYRGACVSALACDAKVLMDPEQETEARAFLRDHFAAQPTFGLKALLAAAPFEGLELDRPRDPAGAFEGGVGGGYFEVAAILSRRTDSSLVPPAKV